MKLNLSETNKNNKYGSGGAIANAYQALISELWLGNSNYLSPWDFRQIFIQFVRQFAGFSQHDSHEMLTFMLDALHEDVNRIKSKPYQELIEKTETESIQEASERWWLSHLKRENSIIVDLFHGQYKSVVECPTCKRLSTTFDPFMFLPLPIPNPTIKINFCLVTEDCSIRILTEKITEGMFVEELHSKLSEYLKISKRFLIPLLLTASNKVVKRLCGGKVSVTAIYENKFELMFFQHSDSNFINSSYDSINKKRLVFVLPMEYSYSRNYFGKEIKSIIPYVYPQPFIISENTNIGQFKLNLFKLYRKYLNKITFESNSIITSKDSENTKNNYTNTNTNYTEFSHGSTLMENSNSNNHYGSLSEENNTENNYSDSLLLKSNYSNHSNDSLTKEDSKRQRKCSSDYTEFKSKEDDINFIRKEAEMYFGYSFSNPMSLSQEKSTDEEPQKDISEYPIRKDYLRLEVVNMETEKSLYGESVCKLCNSNDCTNCEFTRNNNLSFSEIFELVDKDKCFNILFRINNEVAHQSLKNLPEVLQMKQNQGMASERSANIYDCLDVFKQTETLEEDNPWYCNICKEHKQAFKSTAIYKPPLYLIIQLKRFKVRTNNIIINSMMNQKNEALINFPVKGLVLDKYIENSEIIKNNSIKGEGSGNFTYDLYAVSQHYGSLGGGHYTAVARNDLDILSKSDADETKKIDSTTEPPGNDYSNNNYDENDCVGSRNSFANNSNWSKFDDESVYSISENSIVDSSAYLLFYKRVFK